MISLRTRQLLVLVTSAAIFGAAPAIASAMTSSDNTPFRHSPVIAGAHWASARHSPPRNQFGDILPITWGDDNNLYVLMDDGATDSPKPRALWRNSFALITGAPLQKLRLRRIGRNPPPATWQQIHRNRTLWSGPLGSYYSTGFTSVGHVFYATRDNDWRWGVNGQFAGLHGIAYSTDHGARWSFAQKSFPAPLGNLEWVQRGRDAPAPDGYAYAISTEREFNASSLVLGRSRTGVANVTDPARWRWASGWAPTPSPWPTWSSSAAAARPVLTWPGHITYPRMSFDPGLRRYLLTFTYSYGSAPPAIWKNGAELVILDAPHPWGPFTFVARQPYFGPSNGYDPTIPIKWISNHGRDLWLVWAANFDGCARGLSCAARYGFNYQRVHLLVGAHRAAAAAAPTSSSATSAPAPPRQWRALPATGPPFQLPRLKLGPAG